MRLTLPHPEAYRLALTLGHEGAAAEARETAD